MKKLMKNPCWKGYVAYGFKKTRKGKRAPNCVRNTVRKKTRRNLQRIR